MSDTQALREAAERLRGIIQFAEDGAGTLPAREAVKLDPRSWHRVCDLGRQAADALEAAARELAAERKAREEAERENERLRQEEETWVADYAALMARADALERMAARAREALEAHDRYMRDTGFSGPEDAALHPRAAENWRRVRAALAQPTAERAEPEQGEKP